MLHGGRPRGPKAHTQYPRRVLALAGLSRWKHTILLIIFLSFFSILHGSPYSAFSHMLLLFFLVKVGILLYRIFFVSLDTAALPTLREITVLFLSGVAPDGLIEYFTSSKVEHVAPKETRESHATPSEAKESDKGEETSNSGLGVEHSEAVAGQGEESTKDEVNIAEEANTALMIMRGEIKTKEE